MQLIEAAMGSEADLVALRFARGCRCFAVIVDGGVAGYGWLSIGPEWIGELQLEIRPSAGEGYIWNCSTVREHRRRGIFRALLVGISEIAFREGIRRLWIGSVAIPAERAVEPSGFQATLHFTTLSFAGLHCMNVTPSTNASLKLISSGREALGSREQPLRLGWSIRLARHRIH
ncbi:MAG: GNAT family N-acetyltransferase [Chloroflexi bacterium]|nr:MAG: GNAT family N-acetyltransferase [Chloroflexota bacterium]